MRIDRRWMGRLAAAALSLATGCVDKTATEPRADAVIVQAVLDAGASDQYVVVQTTNGAIVNQNAVAGASVTLALPDGRVIAGSEARDSTRAEARTGEPIVGVVYRFALDTAGVVLVPGATYALRVQLPDARVVTGTTTIPDAVALADGPRTAQDFDIRDTLRLAWQSVPGARAYEVRVEADRNAFSIFTDTSIALSMFSKTGGDSPFSVGKTNQLVVSAVDANYYDYYRHAPDSFTGNGVINHLVGGIGVFGSIVELDRRTLVVH